jgi:aminopeptidase N
MDLYFERWDGHAVTVEQFVACFEGSSGRSLGKFFRWYAQAGTPHVVSRGEYNAAERTYRLAVSQTTSSTPGQSEKEALPIPLKIGLIGYDGTPLSAILRGTDAPRSEFDLVLETESAGFVFEQVEKAPIPAIMRGFCAPVALDDGLGPRERLTQMSYDPDPFTRWEAGQSLISAAILSEASGTSEGGLTVDRIAAGLLPELDRADRDAAFMAVALRAPSLARLIQLGSVPDMEALFQARNAVCRKLALALQPRLEDLAAHADARNVSAAPEQAGRRDLRNAAIELLAFLGTSRAPLLAKVFEGAGNMTEKTGALTALSHTDGDWFDVALDRFLEQWRHWPLAVDKWFSVQAAASRDDAISRVRRLAEHGLFSLRNPNRVRSLYGAFASGNLRAFHAADGSGYAFAAEGIRKIDPINPNVAARLAKAFESWRRFDAERQAKARAALEGLLRLPLSKNVWDLVERILN